LLVGPTDGLDNAARVLPSGPWSVEVSPSPREALHRAREDASIDMLVLAPGSALSPYTELCRSIKFDKRSSFMCVVVLLPPGQDGLIPDVFEAGADDCIRDSASDREVLLRLLKVMRLKHATDSLEDSAAIILALANAVEGKDHYTCGHVDRVGMYSVAIGRAIGLDAEDLGTLKLGGVVHDIGKIGIPDHILNKPGKLTDEEMAVMQRHPVIGYDILKPLRTFRPVLPIVRWHHERPNGTGYPDGIGREKLPMLARITAVADVFDAICTDRPYRKAFPLPKCRQILSESAAAGQLDNDLVQALFNVLDAGGLSAQAA
jgi:putative two-component system response regulator